MTELPDDVVERARKIVVSEMCTGDGIAPCCDTCPCNRVAMAIINVAVEWEREQCARVAEKVQDSFRSEEYAIPQPLGSVQERFACGKVIAAIRARSRKYQTT